MELQTFLPHCTHFKNTKDLHRNSRQTAEATAKGTIVCTLKEKIKRKRSEVRCTQARGFSEREHKVTPRSPTHTGFHTPIGFILIFTCSPGNTDEEDGLVPEFSFCSPNCNKNSQSGLQIASGRKAAVTRGDLLNDQKERPRVTNTDLDKHKLFIDVFLQPQRC